MVTWLSPMYYARKESRLGIVCFRGLPQNYHIVINVIAVALLICLLCGRPEYALCICVYTDFCVHADVHM